MNRYYRQNRLPQIFILLLLTAFTLAGCVGAISTENWPGLSTDGENLYLAHGSQVTTFNIENGTQLWQFPEEPRSNLLFYSPPLATEQKIYLADYGASGGFLSPGVIVSVLCA